MVPDIDSENLNIFGFWGGILLLKVIGMTLLTVCQRFRKKVCPNPEDITILGKEAKVGFDDPDVERVRRAHLNDLENIVPWFFATWFWLRTGPSTWLARLLIIGFVVSRILHTAVYAVVPLPQPSRAIVFYIGYSITGYMVFSSLAYYHF